MDVTLNYNVIEAILTTETIEVNISQDSVTEVIIGIPGATGATGAAGESTQFSNVTATAYQTNFNILASATEIKSFHVNGISYLEDVVINPPASGTVVYSGDYDLEAGDSVVIEFITT